MPPSRTASRSWAIRAGTAFHDLVKDAVDQGIVVTIGNSPMTDLQAEFGPKGTGYAGVDLYAGGKLTAEAMLAKGLKAGDEAMVYGVFSQAERGQSEKGLADTLEAAGLKVERLEITQEVEQRRLARRAGSGRPTSRRTRI